MTNAPSCGDTPRKDKPEIRNENSLRKILKTRKPPTTMNISFVYAT